MTERLVLTVAEVAEALDVSLHTAYTLIQRGDIGHIRIGRLIKVPNDALNRFLNTHERQHR